MTIALKTTTLARSGLVIPALCFCTSGLGSMPDTYGYSVDDARARSTLYAILDGPVNFIDTSRNYGMGRSEQRIGEVLKARGGLPKGFIVSTKLDRDADNKFDGAQARRSIEESLKALGIASVHTPSARSGICLRPFGCHQEGRCHRGAHEDEGRGPVPCRRARRWRYHAMMPLLARLRF